MSWQPPNRPGSRSVNSVGVATTLAAAGFAAGTSMIEISSCGAGQLAVSGIGPGEET